MTHPYLNHTGRLQLLGTVAEAREPFGVDLRRWDKSLRPPRSRTGFLDADFIVFEKPLHCGRKLGFIP
jgi:hypothetical protein